ncbi:MAG: DNA polymerase I [Tenericutes bacterium]|nr:DNA polymerase I [Mycoplasmatota bacterium]
MKKIILIDGNNLLFRSYYATAYSGGIMKNSKGFPTNALYGFTNMINKIINEEKPDYMLVALDKGKTFRHDSYGDYKAGRQETPNELITQIEYSKQLLDAMGISWKEAPGYEADDIIGTLSQNVDEDKEVLIISSDRDLLQLINKKVKVKLLKSKDYLLLDESNFKQEFGIEPNKVIDLKGLQGDSSDNIPGVKGIGEKTALKLLNEYKSIENIYVNIENIKGKLKDTLMENKDNAFMSKQLATIYKEVPLDIGIDDIKYKGSNADELRIKYEELEFYSFLKNIKVENKTKLNEIVVVEDISSLVFDEPVSIYIELDSTNYHTSNILGVGLYNENNSIFIPEYALKGKMPSNIKYTYDLKKSLVVLRKRDLNLNEVDFDTMIAAYLLNYNIKDDIVYLSNQFGYELPFFEVISKNKNIELELVKELCVKKAKFIYETHKSFDDKLIKEGYKDLFYNIEMPLIRVLSNMEYLGIKVDKTILKDMEDEVKIKLELLSKTIYNYAGIEFNINSYKQLGDVLFDKLKIPSNKKRSTDREYLVRYKDKNPIIEKILEYKLLNKIYTTYVVGLQNYVMEDSKIHTTYNQTLTRTGRLSSIEPNLQNIPIRYEYGKLIRKAFLPDNDLLMSVDYSQIELRVFAHFSEEKNLIDAFNHNMDIHTKTAMDLFGVSNFEVTSDMRRKAKAVNFGILYGISGFGLSENLDVDFSEAKTFMDKYLETFPGIKNYMEKTKEEAKSIGYVKTIEGRKRVIDELNNANIAIRKSGERIALNTPIQGSSADIIMKAMVEIDKKFKEENIKSKMILQIHDELVFDVLKEEKDKVEKLVVSSMENIAKLRVPLKVSVSYGKNWYETK